MGRCLLVRHAHRLPAPPHAALGKQVRYAGRGRRRGVRQQARRTAGSVVRQPGCGMGVRQPGCGMGVRQPGCGIPQFPFERVCASRGMGWVCAAGTRVRQRTEEPGRTRVLPLGSIPTRHDNYAPGRKAWTPVKVERIHSVEVLARP
eukprot:352932-Chlamydomonas_euryale.AAC.1